MRNTNSFLHTKEPGNGLFFLGECTHPGNQILSLTSKKLSPAQNDNLIRHSERMAGLRWVSDGISPSPETQILSLTFKKLCHRSE
jgi:hypothetical protein